MIDRLGPYRVVDKLGEGGMGEVYRATDVSLGRQVALKVLPPDVATDADRVARFRREAQTLASLNHPHIAAIYGFHEAERTAFLVLELVEGEDLDERLQRGPLPVDEALNLARQIAEALEAAHERGIVHRDLKPANVKVTRSGIAKVLDFGLAKAYGQDGAFRIEAGHYTTLAVEGTAAGVILGTPAYMAPEQVRGQAVDKRADVWAFGVVLYEMLTGRRLFAGATVTDVLAAVVTADPDWSRLPEDTPAAVRRLLRRCLQRDPRRRLPDIGAARLELTEVLAGDTEPEALHAGASRASRVRRAMPWLVSVLALAAAATFAIVADRSPSGDPPQRPPLRLTIDTPRSLSLVSRTIPVISPDGRHVVVVGREQALHLRRMDSLAFEPLPGTQGASSAFWSPDGRRIGFTAGAQVKAVTLGGEVQTVCTLDGVAWGGAWGAQGALVVSRGPNTHNDDGATLVTVSPSSGAWAPLTVLDASRGELAHGVPEFLPDGRQVAFAVVSKDPAHSGAYVASVDAPGSHRPLPLRTNGAVRFADGFALVSRDSNILAYRFDADRLETTGEPILLAADLVAPSDLESFGGFFSVSRQGVLVYLTRLADEVQLAWVTRDGTLLARVGRPERCQQFTLSPDETRAALQVRGPEGGASIWILDLARGVPVRLASGAVDPVWSPDGSELVFTSATAASRAEHIGSRSPSRLFRKSARHDTPAVPVLPPDVHGPAQMWGKHWVDNGRMLLYLVQVDGRNRAFSTRLDGTSAPVPLDLTETVIDEMQLSPDGRHLAYIALERGRSEVLLQPFAGAGERVRVSPDSGGQPKWRPDGRELYYVTPGGALMAVTIGPRGELDAAPPRRLFDIAEPVMWLDQYAPSRDGQRFLVRLPVESGAPALRVVSDWQPASGGQP